MKIYPFYPDAESHALPTRPAGRQAGQGASLIKKFLGKARDI